MVDGVIWSGVMEDTYHTTKLFEIRNGVVSKTCKGCIVSEHNETGPNG